MSSARRWIVWGGFEGKSVRMLVEMAVRRWSRGAGRVGALVEVDDDDGPGWESGMRSLLDRGVMVGEGAVGRGVV